MKLWKCSVCGYIHEGDDAPDKCPKCGALKDKLVELSQEEADKVYKSDRTNDIHMELVDLASKLAVLCEEGIKLNLDPGCVSNFEKTKNMSWVIKQMAKAEIEIHMKKGKW